MRFLALLLVFSATCFPQTARTLAKPSISHDCEQELGFCVDYPVTWKMLGSVYDGHGISVAPPQKGDQSQWAQVTVAAVEIPSQEGKNPPSVEDFVTSTVGKMAEKSENMETVRRSQETLAHHPAQLLQIHYDENGNRWGETVVATDGGQGIFYVVVYKALATDEAKYQSDVESILKSFRLTR